MNELERRVRDAFDAVELPAAARTQAFAAIDALAARDAGDGAEVPRAVREAASRQRAVSPAKPRAAARTWRQAAFALAACLALAAVGLFGSKLYFEETAFVGIDVNPSIELGINRFDLVVSAKALNADGEELLDAVALVGKPYDEAVDALTASEAFAPYLQDSAYIEINVTSGDPRQSEVLQEQSTRHLRDLPCEGSCHAANAEDRASAAAVGMGVGRYQAALELLALDESLTLEDCAAMSMRELRDRIASYSADAPDDAASGNGHSGPHGAGHGSGRGQGKAQGAGEGRGGSAAS